MRPLKTQEESKVLAKLNYYIGDNTKTLLENYELRLNNKRIFLANKTLLTGASQIGRDEIIACGIILGKITKTEHFRITITGLHVLHKYALYKAWIKTSAEMNYLYGNNALKSHIFKISESIPINAGVFVFSQHQVPLGFGVMALNPTSYSNAKGGDSVILNQADNGEYIRNESTLS